MGLVFKARHRLLDKVVVLKLVPAECMADPARLGRFQREMRVMGQLEHPNLVTASDARVVGDWHLVVMELIDGVDLHQLVRTHGPLPVAAACEAARQAARGLQHAHQHGLIHRDIKPSNLMLTRSGTIKVIDMGLALIREDSTAQLTQTGLVLGTMSYCAPEQFRDPSHVDIRADIYSLGCTLFHLLTGKSPYWQRKTLAEIMQAHLHEPFPSLAEALPDAPAGLEAVLARMTAKDRDARFSTPSTVVEALEPFARGADLRPLVPAATQQSSPRRATAGKGALTPERQRAASQEQQPKARWTRRAALLLALLAITGAAFFFTARHEHVGVLMDTTAEHGIYDDDNRRNGNSNAKEVAEALRIPDFREVLPQEKMIEVPVGLNWARKDHVRSLRPHLLIIHRSVFYHPWAAELSLPYPPFKTDEEFRTFAKRYRTLGDNPLREFLGDIGNAVPRTRFLVYSRGTDTNWVSESYRQSWVKDLESQYPALSGRVTTMLIPGDQKGTFRDTETRELLRSNVIEILKLPKPREPEKRN